MSKYSESTDLSNQGPAGYDPIKTVLDEMQSVGSYSDIALVRINGISGSVNIPLFAPDKPASISDVRLILDTTTSNSDASNKWGFNVRNVTQGNNLLSSSVETVDTEITAETVYSITPDQNQEITTGDVLRLDITKTGTPQDLSSAQASVAVHWRYN